MGQWNTLILSSQMGWWDILMAFSLMCFLALSKQIERFFFFFYLFKHCQPSTHTQFELLNTLFSMPFIKVTLKSYSIASMCSVSTWRPSIRTPYTLETEVWFSALEIRSRIAITISNQQLVLNLPHQEVISVKHSVSRERK